MILFILTELTNDILYTQKQTISIVVLQDIIRKNMDNRIISALDGTPVVNNRIFSGIYGKSKTHP